MTDHNALIEKLSLATHPVKRPWRVNWRVASWTTIALPCAVLASLLVHRETTDWTQQGAAWAGVQVLLAFITGILAIRNAFVMSIAGRESLGWRWFLPLLFMWSATLLFSIGHDPQLHDMLADTRCYTFMVTVSAPMMVLAIAWLSRTRSLRPFKSLVTAGCGVSCMSVTLLSFCHPVHLHPLDLLMHLAAFATIVAATVLLGWRWVAIR